MWKDKKVLVTGINGFIATHLADKLNMLGAEVYGIEKPGKKNKYGLIACDLTDLNQTLDSISKLEPDIIFHLAGQPIASIAKENPIDSFKANVVATLNLLEYCRHKKIPFVYSSTRDIYDKSKDSPFTEGSSLFPKTIYDSTKLAADNLTSAYFSSYGLPVGIIRASNVYGSKDLNFQRVIPKIMKSIALDQKIDLYGDGSSSRDYIHISDLVDGYILLADNLMQGKNYGEIFNLSGSAPLSVKEIIEKMKSISGKEIKIQFSSTQKEVKDIHILNWNPKIGIDEGLRLTYDWYKNNTELYSQTS